MSANELIVHLQGNPPSFLDKFRPHNRSFANDDFLEIQLTWELTLADQFNIYGGSLYTRDNGLTVLGSPIFLSVNSEKFLVFDARLHGYHAELDKADGEVLEHF
jgi:hypothetical protein